MVLLYLFVQSFNVIRRVMIIHKGRGLLNSLINNLPRELHIPGYRFCGPGTKLAKRLARGDKGINALDEACKDHDITYSQHREQGQARKEADSILAGKAWNRVLAKDSSIGEKTAALAVASAMKVKSTLGMGMRKKRKSRVSRKRKTRRIKRKAKGAGVKFSSVVSAAKKI